MRLSISLTLLLFASTVRGDAPAVFKAGFAERDITPAIGSECPGGYGKAYHRTLHDPCKVRAAVFDDGKTIAALVGIDALNIHEQTTRNVRKSIAAKTGMPEGSIMIGASHSHSSGPMAGVMPGDFEHADDFVRKLATENTTVADPKYLAHVEKMLVEAVCKAYETRAPVAAGIGRGREDQIAFNRRFKMRDGRTITHPGQGNDGIVEPAGPTDPEVGVIGCWDLDKKKLVGCVVNFACHATTSPGGISANYIYYLEKAIRGYFGEHVVVVFLNGMSGDITQVDNRNPYRHRDPEAFAAFVGGRVGAEAVKVLLTMDQGTLPPVAVSSRTLAIKRRPPSPERVKASFEIVHRDPKKSDPTEWTFAKEIVLLDAKLKKEPVADVEVQAVQIGPAVFLSVPAEYFCAYGL